MTFYNKTLFPDWTGNLFISALSPGDVRRVVLNDNQFVSEEVMFSEIKSRIRSIKVSPDGGLILLTDGSKDKDNSGKMLKVMPR
jgi:glucose/arabinose dehydrogenase